jgi:acyl carrier protein
MQADMIYTKLTAIFHDVFDDESLVLRPDLTADDVDDWDSLSHLRMIMTVQSEFGIKLSASEIGQLKNVGDLATLIGAKTAPAQA